MSSTNRGAVRSDDDWYETQPEAALPMLERLQGTTSLPSAPVILEPMAGRGALVRLLRQVWPAARIVANELNDERANELEESGADVVLRGNMFRQGFRREVLAAAKRAPDLVFTNPAFSLAQECARDLMVWCPRVDLLQRLGWLGSQDRLPFWVKQRYDLGILAQRPSFAASLTCARYDGHGKTKVKRPCGWALVQYLDAPRAETCPGCGAGVNVSTSDSADYAWYDFHAQSLNQHFHLGEVENVEQGSLDFGEAS